MRIGSVSIVLGFAVAIASGLWSEAASAYPKCHTDDCAKIPGTHTREDVKTACAGAGIEYGQNAHSGGYGCIDRANDQGWIQCDSKGHCIGGGARVSGNPRDLKSYLGTKTLPPRKQ
jgi:hypothetical protein